MTNISLDILSPLLGGAVTAVVALVGLFFKWLTSSFKKIEQSIEKFTESAFQRTEMTVAALNEHEDHDQRRHEENLYRFEKISVALAKLGAENGTHNPNHKN